MSNLLIILLVKWNIYNILFLYMYLVTKLDITDLTMDILYVENTKDLAITKLYSHLEQIPDKIELQKLENKNIVNVYKKTAGYLFTRKDLIQRYQILEFLKPSNLTKAIKYK